ncbi:MAG: hypothetical protein AcusKO_44410 [Acuticoccus sp.]
MSEAKTPMEAMTAPTPGRVFVTGAFDMHNYGNLLFPLIAAYRLAPHGVEVAAVSPTGRRPDIADAMGCCDIDAMFAAEAAPRAILIGGGNTFHDQPMAFMEDYGRGLAKWASTGLWLGATAAAAVQDVPAIWNAPGIPVPIANPRRRAMVAAALRAADYVSVRDTGSARTLAPPTDINVPIVPDTVADLARMWPAATLVAPFRDLLARKGADPAARHLAFHVRARALGDVPIAQLAAWLDGFAAGEGIVPILIAIGPGLGDCETVRELSHAMQGPHVVLDDPVSLREIAAAIAHARLYVGASLHAYITSAAYGVPAVLVARPARRKFGGFLAHVERPQDLAREWSDAFALGSERLAAPRPRMPDTVPRALDAHWRAVDAALADPARRRGERGDFLRTYLRFALTANGPAWGLQPTLTHAGRAALAAAQTTATS